MDEEPIVDVVLMRPYCCVQRSRCDCCGEFITEVITGKDGLQLVQLSEDELLPVAWTLFKTRLRAWWR